MNNKKFKEQVLRLVDNGLSLKEIYSKTGISPETVNKWVGEQERTRGKIETSKKGLVEKTRNIRINMGNSSINIDEIQREIQQLIQEHPNNNALQMLLLEMCVKRNDLPKFNMFVRGMKRNKNTPAWLLKRIDEVTKVANSRKGISKRKAREFFEPNTI